MVNFAYFFSIIFSYFKEGGKRLMLLFSLITVYILIISLDLNMVLDVQSYIVCVLFLIVYTAHLRVAQTQKSSSYVIESS